MEIVWCVLLLTASAFARDVTDEEYAKFPRLYHLDDYDSCLSQAGGLYCLGTFHISPLKEPNPMYNMLEEYSMDRHHFNRTQLHRGYCVSSRCPAFASERNVSLRFERCASQWARRLTLRTSLSKLSYCRTHAQEYARTHSPEPMDLPQKVFLYVVAMLLVLNTVGTTYDVITGDSEKKNPLLICWSLRNNWRRLTATYEDGDPRLGALTPVQGIRVLLMVLIMMTHSGCIHVMLYVYNPRWIEQVSRHPVLMLFLNGTSVVQIFVLLSNFLLAYNLLLYTKTKEISFKLLPFIAIKRIARISPVYLLAVGYAATWWARASSGPLWSVVNAESEACRRKFWTHVFFVNNMIDPEDICLIQTWVVVATIIGLATGLSTITELLTFLPRRCILFISPWSNSTSSSRFLAVDTQLYLLASVLTMALAKRREAAIWVLSVLVVASSVLNGVLAYIFDWQALMYFAYPSALHTMYRGIPSFSWLYQSTWGSLPPCLIGLLLAFVHFELQERGVKLASYRWLYPPYKLAPLGMVAWILAGTSLRQRTAPWFVAAYVALERPVLSLLGAAALMGMVNGMGGWLKHLLAWRGWYAMGRMSLSVLMLHWCINLILVASRPQPVTASILSSLVDWVSTSWLSYMLAIPLTIMVEMPVQRFVMALLI